MSGFNNDDFAEFDQLVLDYIARRINDPGIDQHNSQFVRIVNFFNSRGFYGPGDDSSRFIRKLAEYYAGRNPLQRSASLDDVCVAAQQFLASNGK